MTEGSEAVTGSERRFEGNRLATKAGDLFGFKAVADLVAGAVVDATSADCMVIGLEGEWGSGKSTLLSILEQDLELRGVSAVRFAPWLIGSRDALLRELIDVLEKGVAEKLRKGGDSTNATLVAAKTGLARFRRYSTGVAALGRVFSGAGSVGLVGGGLVGTALDHLAKTMKDGVEETTLEDAKKDASEALGRLESRIVVLIDDMDRLEPVEAVEVLRLVQAVADFPNVTYVLSYDRQRLSESVETVIKVGNGGAYLEKLIQLVVPLPQPHPVALVDMFTRRLKILASLDEFDDRMADIVVRHVGPRIRTPRGVVRVLDSIGLLWPVLKGKVNIVDLVWLQFVRAEDDGLYRWIEAYVAEASRPSADMQRDEVRERVSVDLQKRLNRVKSPIPDWAEIRAFLPMAGSRAGKAGDVLLTVADGNDVFKALQERRLSSLEHARIYFGLMPPEGATSQGGYDALLAVADDGAEVAARLRSLATLPSDGGPAPIELVLGLLAVSLTQLEPGKLLGLSKGLITTLDEIVRVSPVADRRVFSRMLADIIDNLNHLQTVDSWSSMLEAILSAKVAVDFLTNELPRGPESTRSAWVMADGDAARIHRHVANAYADMTDRELVDWAPNSKVLDAWKIADDTSRAAFLSRVIADDVLFAKLTLGMHNRLVSSNDDNMRILGEHFFATEMHNFWDLAVVIGRLEELLKTDAQHAKDIGDALGSLRRTQSSIEDTAGEGEQS